MNSVVLKVSSRSVKFFSCNKFDDSSWRYYLAKVLACCSFVLMWFRALTAACSPGRWLLLSSQKLQLSASNITSHSSKQFLWKCGRPFVKNVFHLCLFVSLWGIPWVFSFRLTLVLGEPLPEYDTKLRLRKEVRTRDLNTSVFWTEVLFWRMLNLTCHLYFSSSTVEKTKKNLPGFIQDIKNTNTLSASPHKRTAHFQETVALYRVIPPTANRWICSTLSIYQEIN